MQRRLLNILFVNGSRAAVGATGLLLLFLIGVIVWNGVQALSLRFLVTASSDFGAGGGVLYQIVGSVLLVAGAAATCFPVALGTAVYKSEYLERDWLQRLSDVLIYGLNGIPSVIFGVFGLIVFVNMLGTGISWFVGAVVLGIMILPTVTLAAYLSINSIPSIYRESALSLGLSRWQVVSSVVLPQGLSGAVTGLLIGLARAVGETAPIMFIATAFSGVGVPHALFDPVAALPTHVLELAQQATDPEALQNAWGASLVLLSLVLLLSTSALLARLNLRTLSQR